MLPAVSLLTRPPCVTSSPDHPVLREPARSERHRPPNCPKYIKDHFSLLCYHTPDKGRSQARYGPIETISPAESPAGMRWIDGRAAVGEGRHEAFSGERGRARG